MLRVKNTSKQFGKSTETSNKKFREDLPIITDPANDLEKCKTDNDININSKVDLATIVPFSPSKKNMGKSGFVFPKSMSNSVLFSAVLYGKVDRQALLNESANMGLSLNYLRYATSLIKRLPSKDYFVEDDAYINFFLKENSRYVTPAASLIKPIEVAEFSIHHSSEHFTAFVHGQKFVLAFETIPTRNDQTAASLYEVYQKPVLIIPWIDQTTLAQRNMCGMLSILALLSLEAEHIDEIKAQFDYVFADDIDEGLEQIYEVPEDTEDVMLHIASPREKCTTEELEKTQYQTTEDEYDPEYKSMFTVKKPEAVFIDETEPTSGYDEMKQMFAFVKDYTHDFFKEVNPKAALFVTAISANLFSLLYMAYSCIKTKKIKVAMVASIVSFISLVLTAISWLDSDFEFPSLSPERLFELVTAYWKPSIKYDMTENPEAIVADRPTAAQLLQLRAFSGKPVTYSKVNDKVVLPHLEKFPARLLKENEMYEIYQSLEKPKKQSLAFEEILDKIMSPIAAILVLFGYVLPSNESGTNIIERAMKECKAKLSDLKTHKENMLGVREQLLDFFSPNDTLTSRLIKQKRANIEAVQSPIAILATNPEKYNQLMKAYNDSNRLSKGIMSANGKNVMFQAYMASVSSVENKVMEYRRAITDVLGRQDPTAVYFHGAKGIGKSTMITSLLNRDICNRLGLKPTTFNARVNPDGFYSVYCGETVAYMDEVGDEQDSRKIFELINQLLSTTTVNIPSAFVKDQPFVSPFLFLISNYNLTASLATSGKKPETASAMRSRFIEIEVRNPKVDITKPRGFNKEWYDIGNFEFYVYDNNLDNSDLNPNKHRISYEQLLDTILSSYTKRLEDFKLKVSQVVPYHQAITNPFSVTFAGTQDTGKTTRAEELIRSLQQVFPHLPLRKYSQLPTELVKGPQICFLNDVVTATNLNNMTVLHQLEELGKDSIVINTTNVERSEFSWFSILTTYPLFYAFILNCLINHEIKKPSIFKPIFKEVGLYRRLGFSGSYLINGKIESIASSSSCYVGSQSGFLYKLNNQTFDSSTINHNILLNLEGHRSGATANFQETTSEERVKANWHAYFYANSLEELLSYHQTFTVADIVYDNIENGKLTIRSTTRNLAGCTIDPKMFARLNLTPSNCHDTILGFLTYIVKTIPKLCFTLQIGDLFYWTDNGKVLHNKPNISSSYCLEGDKIVDVKTKVSVNAQDYIQYYANGVSELSVTQTLLMTQLKKANFVPDGYELQYDTILNDSIDTITLTRTKMLVMEMRTRFKSTYFYMFIGFFLSLLSGYALYKVFTGEKKIEKQGKRANRGFGVGKRTGKRYVIRSSGVVYSGDEEWREDLFEDMMEREDFNMDDLRGSSNRRGKYAIADNRDLYKEPDFNYEQAEVTNQADTNIKTIYVDHDYYLNLLAIKKGGGYNLKIITNRGLIYDKQDVRVCDSTNSAACFTVKCYQSLSFDSLGDLLTVDNNLRDMGFKSFSELRKFLTPNVQYQILTTTARVSKPFIGLNNADINLITSGKLQYIQTIIDNPLNLNKVVSLDDTKFHPIVVAELNYKPEGKIGGITEFASKRRRYFRVVAFDNVCHQQLSKPVRDSSHQDTLVAKIHENAVIVVGQGKVGGFFVLDDWVLTTKHVISSEENYVYETSGKEQIPYKVLEIIPHPTCDYALLRVKPLPSNARGHKSLLDAIYDGVEIKDSIPILIGSLSTEPAYMAHGKLNDIAQEVEDDYCGPQTLYNTQISIITPDKITRAGDCGRPYIYTNNMGVAKIIAIHFAGSAYSALGVRLDKQWIVDNLQRSKVKKQATLRYDIPEFTGKLSLIGRAPRVTVSPTKPYSEKSILSNYLSDFLPNMKRPVKTSISQCTPEEIASMRTNAFGEPDFFLDQVLQYNDPVKDFPTPNATTFVKGFISEYGQHFTGNHAGRILSDDECLNGIRNTQDILHTYTNSLNWNGSIGYDCQTKFPNVHTMKDIVDFPNPDKAVFNNTAAAHFVSEKFSRHVLDSWEGLRHSDTLQDNLKQENRVNEKAYKQRVFTSFPKSLSMLIRKFTLRFASVLSKYHTIMPYKIGLNAYAEWHPMHMQALGFAGKEPEGFGFDLSRCDKHMTPQFFEEILKPIMIHFVNFEHRKNTCNCSHDLNQHLKALDVVVEHLYHNTVASQDCLYEKFTGNSSGSDLTIVINSIYVDWLCFNFFSAAAKTSKLFPASYTTYRNLMLVWCCGDDAKITVPLFHQVLNFKCMKTFLAHHGITIDTPLKDGNEQPISKIVDIPFVSRSWVLSPHGYYLPKFKEEVLSGLIYWTSEHTMEHIDNILTILVEHATAYGKEAYESLCTMIQDYKSEHCSNFIVPTYEESLNVLETRVVGFAVIHVEDDFIKI